MSKIKKIIQKLYDENKFILNDNQIHTVIDGHLVEIKANFREDGVLRSLDVYLGHSNRMMDYRLVFQNNNYEIVLRKDRYVTAIRKDN